ncbi:hypothetical protein ACP70R_015955 [Stipagrostis hirtigluma subsp. patula]
MRNSSSPAAVEWGDDSAGEMDSEDTAAAAVGIVGMMEVDADDRHPPSAPTLPVDANFFNAFPDDFDDQDLA